MQSYLFMVPKYINQLEKILEILLLFSLWISVVMEITS